MSATPVKIEESAAGELPGAKNLENSVGAPSNGLLTIDVPSPADLQPQADDAPSSNVLKVLQPADAPAPSKRGSLTISGTIVAPTAAASKSSKSKKKKAQPAVAMASTPTSQSGSQGAQGENTGRWTAEEHRLFLQGLEQHGKGWKKIASLIKSRTVVQIRTHAQKYFQKLAKARQNGDDGDVTMEGRVGASSVTAVAAAVAQNNKRRRQTTGTKRKAIQSVVGSAMRQGKKMATAQSLTGVLSPAPPIPAIAPALAPFLDNGSTVPPGNLPPLTAAQGAISGPALEDSLFRFLTPVPVAPVEPQVNDVARQAGANPITLPTDNPSTTPTPFGGEISPTGVSDWLPYPSWADAKDTPSWYARGGDVDELLENADALDWFADTGDLHETYQPPSVDAAPSMPEFDIDKPMGLAEATSVNTLPAVDSNVEDVVPPLPSLFDGSDSMNAITKQLSGDLDHIDDDGDEHLDVFDSPMEEHEFVSTLLESTGESSLSLPNLK